MTRADELRQRADNCEHMKLHPIAADLRQLAQMHELFLRALPSDSGVGADELVSQAWGILDPGKADG